MLPKESWFAAGAASLAPLLICQQSRSAGVTTAAGGLPQAGTPGNAAGSVDEALDTHLSAGMQPAEPETFSWESRPLQELFNLVSV